MTASKDDNGYPVLYGVSHLDGRTPVRVKFVVGTRVLMVDTVTSIAFDPTIIVTQNTNEYPFALATSSSDDSTVAPWVVNATTGAVLIST